jgi:predicted SAM-dependent methyltransferase
MEKNTNLKLKEPLKLDIGAGGLSSDSSFTSVDAFTEADIKAFMWDIPLENDSVDVIFTSNALEHVSKFAVVPTLREWHRILKPGGKLQILVPDLEWAVKFWLERQTTDWAMDIIFGNQLHEGEYHKT